MIDARVDDEPAEPKTTGETPSSSSSSKKSLTDDDVAASACIFLLAGYDTISSTLAFASCMLAINPEKQDKLCAEIDAYYEDKDEVGESLHHDVLACSYSICIPHV